MKTILPDIFTLKDWGAWSSKANNLQIIYIYMITDISYHAAEKQFNRYHMDNTTF